MKILLVSPYGPEKLNGISKYIERLAVALKEKQIEVEILTFKEKIKRPEKLNYNGITTYYYPLRTANSFIIQLYYSLYSIIFILRNGFKYDIIHSHSYSDLCSLFAILLSKMLKKPNLITLHGYLKTFFRVKLHPKGLLNKILNLVVGKIQFSLCDALISVSKFDLEQFNRYFLTRRNYNLFYIPNGIYLGKKVSTQEKRLFITHIGGLNYHKGFDIFIKIAEGLNRKNPNIPILIIGYKYGIKELDNMLKRAEQFMNIIYFNEVKQIDSYYLRTRVYVITSRTEGMSTTLLEAMKYNAPIVATNIEANSYLIEDGFNGFLFNFNNTEQAIDKIQRLLTNKKLVEKFTKNSKALLQENHDWNKIVEKNILVYKKILSP